MKRLILLVALVMAMAVLAPAAFADDEAPEEPADTEIVEEKELSEAQQWKAMFIADYFAGFPAEEEGTDAPVAEATDEADETLDDALLPLVLDLRETAGWGAVFKLMMYAAATGEDPSLIGPLAGDSGYAFGQLLRNPEFEGEFTNLGQLQKSYKEKPAKPAKDDMPGKSQKNKDKHSG